MAHIYTWAFVTRFIKARQPGESGVQEQSLQRYLKPGRIHPNKLMPPTSEVATPATGPNKTHTYCAGSLWVLREYFLQEPPTLSTVGKL